MSSSNLTRLSGGILLLIISTFARSDSHDIEVARLSIDNRIQSNYLRVKSSEEGYLVACSDIAPLIPGYDFSQCDWLSLNSLGVIGDISNDDVGNLIVELSLASSLRQTRSIYPVKERPTPDKNLGAYFNYEVSASSFQSNTWSAALGLVVFNGPLSASANTYYIDNKHYLDDRDISYDFLEQGTRLTVGDVRWQGAAFGPYISFDGLRYGTQRSLRPRETWFNSPYLDVSINENDHLFVDQATAATLSEPGIYRVDQVAYRYGYGEISATYQSPTKGVTQITTPYYFSADMLPEGTKEWSVNLGETDSESMFGDEVFVSSGISYGINVRNTVSASILASDDTRSLDAEWTSTPASRWLLSIGSNHLVHLDDYSHGYSANLERTTADYQLTFFTQRTPDLPGLGRSERHLTRYRQYQGNKSYGVFFEDFSAQVSSTRRAGVEFYANDEVGSFNLQTGYQEDSFGSGFFVALGFEFRLDRRSRLRGYGSYQPQSNQQRLEYSSTGIDRYTPNYRAGVARDTDRTVNYADIDYHADFADFYVYAQESDGDADGRVTMRGSVGFIENFHFAGPTIVDGFALVANPEEVEVRSSSLSSNKTSVIFTNIASYEAIAIRPYYQSIDPFLRTRSEEQRDKAAYYRGGVIYDFSLEPVLILNTRLVLANGEALPLGTSFSIAGNLYSVGNNGNFYGELTLASITSVLQLENSDYLCELALESLNQHQLKVSKANCQVRGASIDEETQ
ncbi:hypothetical protein [uncultured Umboniibacter sp.]|uniref:hypothetical protein n=1 Tax=uncultured Umboniibacter sp. TaxID=1798917 RepID=UPI00260F8B98|nr:hypothetical protein [uncultured Umboniibacter sp.]